MQEHNIECYTGEKYLREIDEETKKRLIKNNPLLPYAIIATENEISLIEQLASNIELNQVIPVVRFNRRDQEIDLEQQDLRFISSPRNMTLSNEDIGNLIRNLAEEKERKLFELGKAAEVIDRVNRDYQIIANFKRTREKADELENEMRVNEQERIKNEKAMQACDEEIYDISRRQEELAARIEDLRHELAKKEIRINDFEKYLEKNAAYMENLRLLNGLESKIKALTVSKNRSEDNKARLEKDAAGMNKELDGKNSNLRDIEDKLKEVADSSEDELIDEGISELEGRLEACKKQQNNEVADLNEQIEGLIKDIRDIEKDIGKLKLATEEYKDIVYSESVEMELEDLCGRLAREIEDLKAEKARHDKEITRLSERIRIAKEGLGGNPIVPIQEIKGNFAERRRDVRRKRLENENMRKNIQESKFELARLLVRIEAEIKDIMEIRVDAAGKIQRSAEEVKAAIDVMLHEYNSTVDKSNNSIDLFRSGSSKFISRYANYEEGAVKEAVKGLQCQIEALDRTYEKYYYLAERIEYYSDQLLSILKILESKMQQLEHSRKDLTEHAFMEARRIYHEIPKISENSAVEIDGVRKRVLEIQYEEMTDELQAREKMGAYIQECLQSLTKLIKSNEDENRLRRDIEKYVSTKELLNIISNLENCRIRAYKVDLNEKNRRMLPWEDIIIKNSGGEKFVAYFSLLVALISYSRKQIKGYDAFNKKEESKVLIMDNPFGPITSGHLLKPMFDIAKKYNTQLICLSDIKQGSVVNSFNLIYMIKIRQNMMQEDYLEVEPVLLKELKQDEKLENIHLYSKSDQISLFE